MVFSGLPGTGKSTLAQRLAADLGWPLLAIDDLTVGFPAGTDWSSTELWDQIIMVLLANTERMLRSGVSVVVDSVFMNLDRFHARAIAADAGARFRPVHTIVSDETEWERRVTRRFAVSDPSDGVASWSRIQAQREGFRPWEPGTALVVDTLDHPEATHAVVLAFVNDPDPALEPLPDVPFVVGDYHRSPS